MKDSRMNRESYRSADRYYDDNDRPGRSPRPPNYERHDKYRVPVHKASIVSDDDYDDYLDDDE